MPEFQVMSAINSVFRSAITQAIEAHEQRTLAEIAGRLAEGYAVTAGPQEVLDALRNRRLGLRRPRLGPGQLASRSPLVVGLTQPQRRFVRSAVPCFP
jgi:hypothetical protein